MDYWLNVAKETLSDAYLSEMHAYLAAHYFRGADLSTDDFKSRLSDHLYGRMLDNKTHVVPWIDRHFPLRTASVLEIGCGTGSSTISISEKAQHITAWEIETLALGSAKKRAELLGCANISFELVSPEWIATCESMLRRVKADVVYLHAVLEHLTIPERIKLLSEIWVSLPSGGIICVYETPNRLNTFDWHSTWLPFVDWLPPDLACLYYGKDRDTFHSAKLPFAVNNLRDLTPEKLEAFYRHGRGASFHEFEISIGLRNMKVLSHEPIERAVWQKDNSHIETLRRMIEKYHPEVQEAFLCPSLDMIIQKP